MSLRINQNIDAINSYRNLSVTQGQMSKSLEKLSSGFRINRAADDAAGLVGRDGRDLIITPHPGEMARLIGTTIDHVQTHRVEVARELATTRELYVVLKGARTVVATPAGAVWINVTGNPGMATGGTGDVLAGVVAAEQYVIPPHKRKGRSKLRR